MDPAARTPPASPPGWAFGYGLRGASHLRAGKICQDAHIILSGESPGGPYLVAAVADGHGDARYDRSEHGAHLAVRAALEELDGLLGRSGDTHPAASVARGFREEFPQSVSDRWRDLVRDHAGMDSGEGNQDVGPGQYSRYGTTLLAALAWKDLLFLGQLGDGDILLKSPGRDLERVFPPDTATVGCETQSLSSEFAPSLWRVDVRPLTGGERLILATDGLSDSFAGERDFLTFAGDLLDRCDRYPFGAVATELPGWLLRCSEGGSGDDISLVVAGFGTGFPSGVSTPPAAGV
jgi:serine/threonine protein phosphatase PrpC